MTLRIMWVRREEARAAAAAMFCLGGVIGFMAGVIVTGRFWCDWIKP